MATKRKEVEKDDNKNEKKQKRIKTTVVNLKGRKPQIIKEGEVYCGRNMYMGGWKLKESKYKNPFKVGKDGDLATVIKKFRKYVEEDEKLKKGIKEDLRGKVLACWCAPQKCHCDVLAEYANKEEKEERREEGDIEIQIELSTGEENNNNKK